MKQNLIIRASAGTGKTFSLATRFLQLMLFKGARPERILALTFSRGAAQEIYTKLLERLWKAAASEEGAAAEKELLLAQLSAEDRAVVAAKRVDFSPSRFAGLLRQVIGTQQHGTIATLDSFILRIVRSFPLEMGFQHAVDVVDGYEEDSAIQRAQAELLAGSEDSEAFAQAFKTAMKGDFVRSCGGRIDRDLRGWRSFYLDHEEACATWTADSMRRALGIGQLVRPDATGLAATGNSKALFSKFADYVEKFEAGDKLFNNKPGEMAKYLMEHPDATAYSYETNSGQEKVCDCGAAGAEFVRAGVRYMAGLTISKRLETMAAQLAMCRMIDRVYDERTRRRGLLTFADFTDCQALAEEDSDTALKLQNLQFRFDSQFDHWALDEFQDTSVLQWKCLRRLVKEAAQADVERSVMAVGDLKQSIYTWRGGNDAPFKEMMGGWEEFREPQGEIAQNAISYRYGANTAEFVNRVFGPENIRGRGLLAECPGAVERWLAEDCWMEHRASAGADGAERRDDCVQVYRVAPAAGDGGPGADDAEDEDTSQAMKVLAPKICERVAALWKRHEAAGSTDTVAVLVRSNRDGVGLAERLRAMPGRSLPVVWEGMGGVLDSATVRAVLELLKLAEHPEDSFAWKAVNELLPVRRLVFPELAHQDKVAEEVGRMLSGMGLARTLKTIVRKLTTAEEAMRPDLRTTMRLESLVREAVAFETRAEATDGIGKFEEFLRSTATRETTNSPHVIRILTIHRSKGLTFDHVVVPVLEASRRTALDAPDGRTPLHGDGWVMSTPAKDLAMVFAPMKKAWQEAADEHLLSELRMYYVALTRARKSTTVFLCEDPPRARADDGGAGAGDTEPKKEKVQFRDLLMAPFETEGGDGGGDEGTDTEFGRLVCQVGTMPGFGRKTEARAEPGPWRHAAGDTRVARRSPSGAGEHGTRTRKLSAATLFRAGRMTASEKGSAEHERLARIGWIDPDAPQNDEEARILESAWREAFVRPSADAALWRERSYERLAEHAWETGQFDRVVFAGTGAERRAVIYDFKTNAKDPAESDEAFARRIAQWYAPQMAAYRAALAALTHLPAERISTCCLLAANMGAVRVG
jgi:ATP-dependent exoDNAse (exonuclease V) beta subunit